MINYSISYWAVDKVRSSKKSTGFGLSSSVKAITLILAKVWVASKLTFTGKNKVFALTAGTLNSMEPELLVLLSIKGIVHRKVPVFGSKWVSPSTSPITSGLEPLRMVRKIWVFFVYGIGIAIEKFCKSKEVLFSYWIGTTVSFPVVFGQTLTKIFMNKWMIVFIRETGKELSSFPSKRHFKIETLLSNWYLLLGSFKTNHPSSLNKFLSILGWT